jgi:DNA-binding NarL/FixJ family response regulator
MENNIVIRAKIDGSIKDIFEFPLQKRISIDQIREVFQQLIAKGSGIIFRLGENEFYLPTITQDTQNSLELAQKQFQKLSYREKSVLTFLSKGYKQSQISLVLNMPVDTYRDIRKRIYRKMKFKSKIDLLKWSEKNLTYSFDIKFDQKYFK